MNVNHFVGLYGRKNCGVFTPTFAEDLTVREAQRRIHNFSRRVLSELFGEYIRVREFTKRGRPHFHFVIDCKGDIATGFNWQHYDEVQRWQKNGGRGPKPKGTLGRTLHLRQLHAELNRRAKAYGIGRLELVPVRHETAIGFYIGGYLSKSIDHRPADAKRTRSITYSQGYARQVKGHWSWVAPSAWLWRAKVSAWAQSHGCASMEEVAEYFGPRWAYHHRDAIMATELEYWPTVEHARADGQTFCDDLPEDAVDIRRNRTELEPDPDWSVPVEPADCIVRARGGLVGAVTSVESVRGTVAVGEDSTPPQNQQPSGGQDAGGGARPARMGAKRCYDLHAEGAPGYRTRIERGQPYQRPLRLTDAERCNSDVARRRS